MKLPQILYKFPKFCVILGLTVILLLYKSDYTFMPIFATVGRRLLSIMASESYKAGMHSMAFVTAPSEDVAKKIASGLVTNKLAACINIIPKVISIYEWKNEVNQDEEVLMMIKTRTSRLEELTTYVRENHPYDVCEVVSSPIEQGNPAYLNWISEIVPEKGS